MIKPPGSVPTFPVVFTCLMYFFPFHQFICLAQYPNEVHTLQLFGRDFNSPLSASLPSLSLFYLVMFLIEEIGFLTYWVSHSLNFADSILTLCVCVCVCVNVLLSLRFPVKSQLDPKAWSVSRLCYWPDDIIGEVAKGEVSCSRTRRSRE